MFARLGCDLNTQEREKKRLSPGKLAVKAV